jgi:hypothetical protein
MCKKLISTRRMLCGHTDNDATVVPDNCNGCGQILKTEQLGETRKRRPIRLRVKRTELGSRTNKANGHAED